jgi:hypothetical protein
MKKFLLALSLFGSVMVGRSQTILNELYVQPGANTSEFFELYYAGTLPIGDNVNCWTLLSYYDLGGGNRGVYVLDLPNVSTGLSDRYLVGAATNPFTAQGNSSQVPDFNWNSMDATGKLTKWRVNAAGTGWVQDADPVNLQDFFNNKGAGGFNYSAMMFVDGVFNNGFLGGTNQSTSPIITSLPDLQLTNANSNVCATFTIHFGTLGAFEHVTEAAGQDNGYNRTADGKCGAWEKSSSSAEHTPNRTNGATSTSTAGSMETFEFLHCNVLPGKSVVDFDIISAGTSGATEAEDFPVDVQLWIDNFDLVNGNMVRGTAGANDVFVSRDTINTFAAGVDTFQIPQTAYVFIAYKTKRGCYDKIVFITNGCAPLPVSFKSFTAVRNNRTNVFLKWETITEQNAAGFVVERNINGSWEQVTYVPSQAQGGNSTSLLTYQLNDLNAAKGISQYRIRQVDLDGMAKISDIRSVRGEGQKGSTIIYPNPSDDGKVNVVFEGGAIAKRNITVQDLSGRIIKEWKSYTNNNIQIENLTPGFYTIRIVNIETGEQDVQKAVVNKR